MDPLLVLAPEDLVKLALAVIIGGLIGAEREFRDKAAGFRTIILICVGSTLFTILSLRLGGETDRARIAAGIVTGVGFLGAGAILRDRGQIVGLTTASTIWLAAALGMGIGGGQYIVTGAAGLVILVVLVLFPGLERRIDRVRETRTYRIACARDPLKLQQLEALMRRCGLRTESFQQSHSVEQTVSLWKTSGSEAAHARFVEQLRADSSLSEFEF